MLQGCALLRVMEKTIYAKEYRLLLEWLRNQRELKGLTVRDLTKRLNVHHSWIGRIEQGERRLDVAEFAKLCVEIGCDPKDGLKLVIPDLDGFNTSMPLRAGRLTTGGIREKKAPECRGQHHTRRFSHRQGA
ncbi:MAG: helix-turn-helix transcriptional regulator [bacterium]